LRRGRSVLLRDSQKAAEAACGPARRPAWPRADLRADLRAASRSRVRSCVRLCASRVRTCVRLCAGRILQPHPPPSPFGSALSRTWASGSGTKPHLADSDQRAPAALNKSTGAAGAASPLSAPASSPATKSAARRRTPTA